MNDWFTDEITQCCTHMKKYNIQPEISLGNCMEGRPCHTFWRKNACNDVVGGKGAPKCRASEYAVNLQFFSFKSECSTINTYIHRLLIFAGHSLAHLVKIHLLHYFHA